MEKNKASFRQEDNQMIHTRLINAPRDLVWEVWTEPEHVQHWWGPDDFNVTNKSMEVKPGGEWLFILHGYGMHFDSKIKYLEVEKPTLLVYRHSDAEETMSFTVFVTFEEAGNQTLLTVRSVFASAAVIAELNRTVQAAERGKQTFNKMEAYIDQLLHQQ